MAGMMRVLIIDMHCQIHEGENRITNLISSYPVSPAHLTETERQVQGVQGHGLPASTSRSLPATRSPGDRGPTGLPAPRNIHRGPQETVVRGPRGAPGAGIQGPPGRDRQDGKPGERGPKASAVPWAGGGRSPSAPRATKVIQFPRGVSG